MATHPYWTDPDRLPVLVPRLLTVAEYVALGETEPGYTELLEGRLLLSPCTFPDNSIATLGLMDMIKPNLPADLEVLPALDVDLELAPAEDPGFVRRPDLIVVPRSVRETVSEGELIRAAEVRLAIEIVSPVSRWTDNVSKRSEYAEAGIPYYWIIDLEPPISLVACQRAGVTGYLDSGGFTGRFRIDEPFPVELSLDDLI